MSKAGWPTFLLRSHHNVNVGFRARYEPVSGKVDSAAAAAHQATDSVADKATSR